jgi:pimeloyl-ACP methyl ester carboxylesterase
MIRIALWSWRAKMPQSVVRKRISCIFGAVAVSAVLALGALCTPVAAQELTPEGYWEGAIEIRGNPMEIAVELKKDAEGSWNGTIDIPAQEARGLRLANVIVDDRAVAFAIAGVPGNPAFGGTLAEDGKSMEGEFTQGVTQLTFQLRRSVRKQTEGGAPSAFTDPGVPGEDLAGTWLGMLDTGAIELRLIARISKNADGGYSGFIDSVDQGAAGLKIDSFEVREDSVRLELKRPTAVFSGKFNEPRSEIEGEWSQGGSSLPLTLHRQSGEPELARPQDPKKPYPYQADEVTFRNEPAGLQFAGTLTVPRGQGPHPAVVLLSGSGAQDRNEAIMGHRPFLVLADYLTRNGIAVLRFDDRGVGGSQGNVTKATTGDFAADALAAVAFLKARPEINARKIGLIGHSEGALVGPLAAVQSNDVAFLVLLAAPGLPGEQLIYLQSEALIRAMAAEEEVVAANRELQGRMFAIVKDEPDDAKARQRLQELQKEMVKRLTPEQRQAAGLSEESPIGEQAEMLLTPWFRFFLTYDPIPTLAKVKCPVLVMTGDNDLQVPPDENLPPIEKALKQAGNRDFKLMRPSRLNHLLQTSETGLPLEYARIEETIAPPALEAIGEWIREHAGVESQKRP